MKIYVTKYALTTGIEETFGEWDEKYPNMIKVEGDYGPQYFHGEGREWHRNRPSAVARAEQMRVAKIASLEKSINKLSKLKFQ